MPHLVPLGPASSTLQQVRVSPLLMKLLVVGAAVERLRTNHGGNKVVRTAEVFVELYLSPAVFVHMRNSIVCFLTNHDEHNLVPYAKQLVL